MLGVFRDVRHALRGVLRAPTFSAVVVVSLGLGIGAATALFTLVDGVLLRPLDFPDSDRLVMAWQNHSQRGGPEREWFSYQDYADLAEEDVFHSLAAFQDWFATFTSQDEPRRLSGGRVTHGMLGEVLGVTPAAGRLFTAEEDVPGAPPVVVLSYGLWARAFGADPGVVGTAVTLDGEPYTVVGVLPESFRFSYLPAAEIWTPAQLSRDPEVSGGRGSLYLRVVGRLRDSVFFEEARARTAAVGQRLGELYPAANAGTGLALHRLKDEVIGSARTPLNLLLGGAVLLLIIGCTNIANLLLGRALARSPEFALRGALGAGRRHMVQQSLIESLLLAAMGGTLGLLVALWGVDLLVALAPEGTPRLQEVGLSGRVFAFAGGVAMLAGVFFGSLPAFQASGIQPASTLRESKGARARRGGLGRGGLVVGQVALALVLLFSAGLVTRSLYQLNRVDLGYDPEGVLTLSLSLPAARYPEAEDRRQFYEALLPEIRSLPGVTAAGATGALPLAGLDNDSDYLVEGEPVPDPGSRTAAWLRPVTDGYVSAMGLRLLAGRDFGPSDDAEGQLVVWVNETMASRHWPGENPIGKRIGFGTPEEPNWREVVGLAADTRHFSIAEGARPAVYFPHRQVPFPAMGVVVRGEGDPLDLGPAVSAAIRRVDPELAASDIRPMLDLVRESTATQRLVSTLMALFSGFALLLSGLGIYGVMAFAVSRRTHELGIRRALGATDGHLAGLVFKAGLALTGTGVVLGLLGALVLSRSLSTLLFQVSPLDPGVITGSVVSLSAVAALACWLPVRKALRLDVAEVLHEG
jgi:putative ABC transport system permease protein